MTDPTREVEEAREKVLWYGEHLATRLRAARPGEFLPDPEEHEKNVAALEAAIAARATAPLVALVREWQEVRSIDPFEAYIAELGRAAKGDAELEELQRRCRAHGDREKAAEYALAVVSLPEGK